MTKTPLCLISWLFPLLALAQGPIGGFPTPKGEVVLAPAYSLEAYDRYFDPEGELENREVETVSYSIFLEAGLSDQLALVATLPYLSVAGGDAGLQDGAVWFKYTNLDNRRGRAYDRVFTAIGLSFPVGDYGIEGDGALGQRASVFRGRLAYQYQHDSGAFFHVQSGIDFQVAPDSRSSWPLLLRAGYGTSHIYGEAWLEFVTAIESGPAVTTAREGAGSSWRRLGGTVYAPLTSWVGLNAGGAVVLSGRQIGKSGRVNLGLVFRI